MAKEEKTVQSSGALQGSGACRPPASSLQLLMVRVFQSVFTLGETAKMEFLKLSRGARLNGNRKLSAMHREYENSKKYI